MVGKIRRDRLVAAGHALPRERIVTQALAGRELTRAAQRCRAGCQRALDHHVEHDAAGRQRRIAGSRRGRAEIDGPAIGRHPSQQRHAPAERGQRRQLARQPAITADLELAHRQGRAALGVRQQVFVAAPGVDRALRFLFRPHSPAHTEKLRLSGCPGWKEHGRSAALDEGLHRPRQVGLGQRCVPDQHRDLIPVDAAGLRRRDEFG